MSNYCPRVCIPSYGGKDYERILLFEDFRHHEQRGEGNGNVVAITAIAWTALLADSPVDPVKPARVINRFLNTLIDDVLQVVQDFSGLADQLMNSVNWSADGDIRVSFVPGMLATPIAREYLTYLDDPDSSLFRFMLTFLLFGKKIYYDWDDLESTALRGWFEVEDRLGNLVLPNFIEDLRHIVAWVFREWEVDFFLPRHGNGAVAEKKVHGSVSKNRLFTDDASLRYMYRKDSMFFINETSDDYFPVEKLCDKPLSRRSRLMFVPKDMKKKRSICMEPISLQYAQQGVRLWIESHIKKCELSQHIVLEDQGMNRSFAQFGSLTGSLDTIDLSSASDSVAWRLIKSIFPPKVLKHLAATRSSRVRLPDGSDYTVEKFAPMGSALCFPVQSILYSCVVILVGIAMRLGESDLSVGLSETSDISHLYDLAFDKKPTSFENNPSKRFNPFLAYGDDIICDKQMTSSVVRALSLLGFAVNEGKSFTGDSCFRESCGGFYLSGVDVTPYTFKPKKIARRMSIATLAGFIDLVNGAADYRYLHLRKHLIQFILHYPIQGVNVAKGALNPILFSEDRAEALAVFSCNVRNLHLKRRYYDSSESRDGTRIALGEAPSGIFLTVPNSTQGETSSQRFQRDEVKSITIRPREKVKQPSEHDGYHYMVWWRARYHGYEDLGFSSDPMKADTNGVSVGWRWTAAV